ncbi:hypothetical protein WA026_010789 [Henosepilachna vigintioctopunctata]|uniref:Uncharacterized protein n=1 Tax=Henosepilachna vigintioctopunctata TaxID=420089 RepID=A0AAW1URZ2_9CUCU
MADVILKALTTTPNTTSSYENVGLSEYSNHSSTFPPLNISESSIKKSPPNDKGYYIDDVDDGLNDLQVLLLACFATLIPLIISVVAAFGIRILWVKYRKRRKGSSYDGMLEREGTSESLNKPLHSHLLNSDKNILQNSTHDFNGIEPSFYKKMPL